MCCVSEVKYHFNINRRLDVVASFASLWNLLDKLQKCMQSHFGLCCILFHFELDENCNYRNFLLLYTLDYSDILCQQPVDFTPLCQLQTITRNGIWELCKALPENLK